MTKNTELDFDLNELALSTEAELHLIHPRTKMPLYAPVAKGEDEESRPVKITLHGPASDQFRKGMGYLNTQKNKRGGKGPRNDEEAREENITFLTMVSVSISNIKFDGEVVDSKDGFKKLYGNRKYEWISKQVTEFLFEDGNFLDESKNS